MWLSYYFDILLYIIGLTYIVLRYDAYICRVILEMSSLNSMYNGIRYFLDFLKVKFP